MASGLITSWETDAETMETVRDFISSVQSLSCIWLFGTHEPQHARPPCPSPTPGAYSNSCPLSRWCHPTISSSVVPYFAFPQSFPASGSFQIESALCIRWPKYWSFSFSIGPSSKYSGFRIDWFDLLAIHGTLKSLWWKWKRGVKSWLRAQHSEN